MLSPENKQILPSKLSSSTLSYTSSYTLLILRRPLPWPLKILLNLRSIYASILKHSKSNASHLQISPARPTNLRLHCVPSDSLILLCCPTSHQRNRRLFLRRSDSRKKLLPQR